MQISIMRDLQGELECLIDTGLTLAQQLYDFSESLGSTGDQLRWLATDISLFSSVLSQITITIGNTKDLHISPSAVQTAQDIVERCQTIFSKTEGAIRLARRGESQLQIIRRVKWWFRKSKVALVREQLSTCSATLHLMLVTMQFAQRLSSRRDHVSDAAQDEKHRLLTYNLFRAQRSSNERLAQLETQFEREGGNIEGLSHYGDIVDGCDTMPPPYSPPQNTVPERFEPPVVHENITHSHARSNAGLSSLIRAHVDRLSVVSLNDGYDYSALNEKQIALLQTNHLLRVWFNQSDPQSNTVNVTAQPAGANISPVDCHFRPPSHCRIQSWEQRTTEALQDIPPGKSAADLASQEDKSPTFLKSFRVSITDPCWKVLPTALRKYNIIADPSRYRLYVVWGDLERLIMPDEAPLAIFKELDRQGKKPHFMLRKVPLADTLKTKEEPVEDKQAWI